MLNTRTRALHGYTLSAQHHDCPVRDAPQVVMVHGMMESAQVWRPLLRALGNSYRCVTLELPWNGLQGAFWGHCMGPEAWLQTALTSFELKPDAWIAHSFGASTVLSLIAQQRASPGARAPMALISPFYKPTTSEVTWPLFQRYVSEFTDFVELSIRTRVQARCIDAEVLQRMTQAARDSFGCYVWVEFWRLFAAMPFLCLDDLKQPALLLTGGEDFAAPLADVQALARRLPQAKLEVYPNASHFLLDVRTDSLTRAVRQFLSLACDAEVNDTRAA